MVEQFIETDFILWQLAPFELFPGNFKCTLLSPEKLSCFPHYHEIALITDATVNIHYFTKCFQYVPPGVSDPKAFGSTFRGLSYLIPAYHAIHRVDRYHILYSFPILCMPRNCVSNTVLSHGLAVQSLSLTIMFHLLRVLFIVICLHFLSFTVE